MNKLNQKRRAGGLVLWLCTFSALAATATTQNPVTGHEPVVNSVTFDKQTPKVGDVVTATAHMTDVDMDSPITAVWQWLRDDQVIPGETHALYTTQATDVGHRLTVRVTPSTPVQTTDPSEGAEKISPVLQVAVRVSAADSTLTASAAPTAHARVTMTLVLKDAQQQAVLHQGGLTLTGTSESTPPAFAETSTPGTYTATFTPTDITALTLGVDGMSELSGLTTAVTPLAATATGTLTKPNDVTVTLGDPSQTPVVTPVNNGTVSYRSSDDAKVSVDSGTGALEFRSVTGSTAVTITVTEKTAGYTDLTTSYTVTVNAAAVSKDKSALQVSASPTAHSPVTVTLKLKDARNQLMRGKTGLTLSGTKDNPAPAFAEDSGNPGEYIATFTPADTTQLTLGVDGMSELSGLTTGVSPLAVIPTGAELLEKPQHADMTVNLLENNYKRPGPVIQAKHGGAMSYSTDAPAVAEVNPTTGELTLKAEGVATIRVTEAEAGGYAEQHVDYTVTVKALKFDTAVTPAEMVVPSFPGNDFLMSFVDFRVLDSAGQPVSGAAVSTSANSSTKTTDSDGKTRMMLLNPTGWVGSTNVIATLPGGATSVVKVYFINPTFSTDRPDIVADSKMGTILTLNFGNKARIPIMDGKTVTFDVSGVDIKTVSLTTVVDEGSGAYTATLKGSATGIVTITPKVGGHALGLDAKVTLNDPLIPYPSINAIRVTSTGSDVAGRRYTGSYQYVPSPEDNSKEVGSITQWLRDGIDIPGATGTSYQAVSGDIGHKLSFSVIPHSAAGGVGARERSSSTGTIKNPLDGWVCGKVDKRHDAMWGPPLSIALTATSNGEGVSHGGMRAPLSVGWTNTVFYGAYTERRMYIVSYADGVRLPDILCDAAIPAGSSISTARGYWEFLIGTNGN